MFRCFERSFRHQKIELETNKNERVDKYDGDGCLAKKKKEKVEEERADYCRSCEWSEFKCGQ